MSSVNPSTRSIGLGVILFVMILAVVLEAWTFIDLVQFQFEEEEGPGVSEKQAQAERVGSEDDVQLAEDLVVSIRRLRVHVTDDGWRYELQASIRNLGMKTVEFRSRQIGLSSGDVVSLDGRQTISPNDSQSMAFEVRIPEGTEARTWTVWFRRGKTNEGETQTVPLDKAPIRRRK